MRKECEGRRRGKKVREEAVTKKKRKIAEKTTYRGTERNKMREHTEEQSVTK